MLFFFEIKIFRGLERIYRDNFAGIQVTTVGFEVKQAANGLEAVKLFEEWHPAFIWMDIRMPVMDGLEATRRIKASENGQHTSIAAFSASVLDDEKAKILAAGCNDFVRKPYREEEIFEVMARHLGLTYVYEPETREKVPADSTLSQETLSAALDDDLRRDLHDALIRLDTVQTMQVIDKIMLRDCSIGNMLKKCAENFEYEHLLSLFGD